MSKTLGISANRDKQKISPALEDEVQNPAPALIKSPSEATHTSLILSPLSAQRLPALTRPSVSLPPLTALKKQRKRWLALTSITLLIGAAILVGAWQKGVFAPHTPTTFFSWLSPVPSSSSSILSRPTVFDFTTCTNAQASVSTQAVQGFVGCRFEDKVYLQNIDEKTWQNLIAAEAVPLSQNQIVIHPLTASELTMFRVGNDLGAPVIVGNTIYSANINANSEAFGLMYLSSHLFSSLSTEQKALHDKLLTFLTTGTGYDSGFFSLVATDKKSVSRPSIFVTTLGSAPTIGADTHFAPDHFISSVILKNDLTNAVFTVQVWLQVRDTTILLEEEFSQDQNALTLKTMVDPCKKDEGDDAAKVVTCIAEKINADPGRVQYATDLMTNLVNKFQIQ
jgi:hypothetical protein